MGFALSHFNVVSVSILTEMHRVNLVLLFANLVQRSQTMEVSLFFFFSVEKTCGLKLVACFVLRMLSLEAFRKFSGFFFLF